MGDVRHHLVMSAAEARAVLSARNGPAGGGREKGAPKYGNKPCERLLPNGTLERYRSRLELDVHAALLALLWAGEIAVITREKPFVVWPHSANGPTLCYVADFVVCYRPGDVDEGGTSFEGWLVVESKSVATAKKESWRLKRRLFMDRYGAALLAVVHSPEEAVAAVRRASGKE